MYPTTIRGLLTLCRDSSWLCNADPVGLCYPAEQAAAAENFVVGDQHISYCLSLKLDFDNKCQLQFSIAILAAVIACNVVKMCCMALTFFEASPTLVTVGDAIQSFLDDPDPSTREMSAASLASFQESVWSLPRTAQPVRLRRYRWFQALSLRRWALCNIA